MVTVVQFNFSMAGCLPVLSVHCLKLLGRLMWSRIADVQVLLDLGSTSRLLSSHQLLLFHPKLPTLAVLYYTPSHIFSLKSLSLPDQYTAPSPFLSLDSYFHHSGLFCPSSFFSPNQGMAIPPLFPLPLL